MLINSIKVREKLPYIVIKKIDRKLTLRYYRISDNFEELFIILVVMTPADGPVLHHQKILVVFVR